jgi:hypothetical protein
MGTWCCLTIFYACRNHSQPEGGHQGDAPCTCSFAAPFSSGSPQPGIRRRSRSLRSIRNKWAWTPALLSLPPLLISLMLGAPLLGLQLGPSHRLLGLLSLPPACLT